MADGFQEDVIAELLEKLAEGESLRTICADKRMPCRETIWRWAERDDDLATAITRARRIGYHARAEKAVEAAKTASDAALGRLAFDADRWHLAKLYPAAFGDKVTQEHVGKDGGPIETKATIDPAKLSTEVLREVLAARVDK